MQAGDAGQDDGASAGILRTYPSDGGLSISLARAPTGSSLPDGARESPGSAVARSPTEVPGRADGRRKGARVPARGSEGWPHPACAIDRRNGPVAAGREFHSSIASAHQAVVSTKCGREARIRCRAGANGAVRRVPLCRPGNRAGAADARSRRAVAGRMHARDEPSGRFTVPDAKRRAEPSLSVQRWGPEPRPGAGFGIRLRRDRWRALPDGPEFARGFGAAGRSR